MKKKSIYIIFIAMLFFFGTSGVLAANSFSDNEVINICGFNGVPARIPKITSGIYSTVKILVPIVLIVMGLIDFLSAVSAANEDKMKKAQKKFITRLIAAVFIFLIMAIVQFVFKQVKNDTKITSCMNCILNNESCDGVVKSGKSETKECSARSQSNCTSGADPSGHTCRVIGTKQGGKCSIDCSSITSASVCNKYSSYCKKWKQTGTSSGTCPNKY